MLKLFFVCVFDLLSTISNDETVLRFKIFKLKEIYPCYHMHIYMPCMFKYSTTQYYVTRGKEF